MENVEENTGERIERKMNRVPLLVKPPLKGMTASLDVSPVIREIFRERLETDLTIQKNEVTLKLCDQYQKAREGIKEAEIELMTVQGMHVSNLENKSQRKKDISIETANKYQLIRLADVISKPKIQDKSKCPHFPPVVIPDELESTIKKHKEEDQVCQKTKKIQTKPLIKHTILTVEPNRVFFEKYACGKEYKRTILVVNKGNYSCRVKIVPPCLKVWDAKFNKDLIMTNIVPGVPDAITVTFNPDSLEPSEDSFSIVTEDGSTLCLPLKAHRPPPLLISIDSLDIGEELSKKDMVLSGTIDCGSKLIGSTNVLTMKLRNIGSIGTFFITNELDWAFTTIKNEDNYYKAEMIPFSISPAVFSLDQNEYISLEVTFEPQSEGTFTEHFKVICNNNSMRTIDVIADAVKFSRNSILFEESIKDFPIDIEDDDDAEYYIDLGYCRSLHPTIKSITIRNLSEVRVDYRWDWRMPQIDGPFVPLTREFIQVSPEFGTLEPRRKQVFMISSNKCDEASDLVYKGILRFLVCGLPFLSISDTEYEFVLEDKEVIIGEQWSNSSELVTKDELTEEMNCFDEMMEYMDYKKEVILNCGEIEVWLHTSSAVITLSTYLIEFQNYKNESLSQKIVASNCSGGSIDLEWNELNWKFGIVTMTPEKVTVAPNSYTIFILNISVAEDVFYHEIYFENKLSCNVNHGESCIELFISGIFYKEDEMPKSIFQDVFPNDKDIFFITDFIVFDPIKVMGTFTKHCDEILKRRAPSTISETALTEIRTLIENKINFNLRDDKFYCHIMQWGKFRRDDYTWTLLDVERAEVDPDVICIKRAWFIDTCYDIQFKLKNYSKLKVDFRWNPPVGLDRKLLDVFVAPKEGELLEEEEKTFTAFITPLLKGTVNDFYITCKIETLPYPICIAICGDIRPLLVNISWEGRDVPMSINWREGIKSYESLTEICDSTKAKHLKRPASVTEEDALMENYEFLDVEEEQSAKLISEILAAVDSNETIQALLKVFEEGESMDEASIISSVSNLYIDWPIIGGKYRVITKEKKGPSSRVKRTKPSASPPCGQNLDNLCTSVTNEKLNIYEWLKIIMEQKAITFDISINERAHRDIIIKNMSPRLVRVEAVSQNFQRSESATLEDRKCYKYFKCPECWGIIMETEPTITCLDGYDKYLVKLSVLGDAWGDYIDVLVVYFHTLPPFSIPVIVHVKGMPIYASFAPKDKEPVLKFGYLFPGEVFTQTVILKNTTFLPLKVVWTAYTEPDEDEMDGDDRPPFTLAIDVHNERPKDFCKLHLLEYLGNRNTKVKVSPSVTYLKPYGDCKLRVIVDSTKKTLFRRDDLQINYKIKGSLIGAIYVNNNRAGKPGLCDRDTGFSRELFKMKVSATVQVPRIKLLNFQPSEFEFFVQASTIIENPDYKKKKVVLLKNIDDTTANIQLFVYHPFYIKNMKHSDMNMVCLQDFRAILTKNQILEVELQFAPGEQDVLHANDIDLGQNEPNIAKMLIYQGEILSEEFTFYYTIMYPLITLWKERIVFGPVFVGNTKRKFISIRSHSTDEKVTFTFEENNPSFTVHPKSGILKMDEPFELAVFFTPSESTMYLNKLVVKPLVKSYDQIITVEGVGTWNSKFQSSY